MHAVCAAAGERKLRNKICVFIERGEFHDDQERETEGQGGGR